MAVILITGAHGLIGSSLSRKLKQSGHTVKTLSTSINNKDEKESAFLWNVDEQYIQQGALDGVEIVVHLAGLNIGKTPWTRNNKAKLISSRVGGARLLAKACKEQQIAVKHFISASGAGFYSDPNADLLTESSGPGSGFLSEICIQWEAAALEFEKLNSAVTIFRTGPVLSANDGYYKEITRTLPFRILPVLGKRSNMLSWIHLDDAVSAYVFAIEKQLEGIYNLVAPEPVDQMKMLKTIAGKSFCFYAPVPAFVLRMAMGERAALPLSNQRVSSEKLQKAGFQFQYQTIQSAIGSFKV